MRCTHGCLSRLSAKCTVLVSISCLGFKFSSIIHGCLILIHGHRKNTSWTIWRLLQWWNLKFFGNSECCCFFFFGVTWQRVPAVTVRQQWHRPPQSRGACPPWLCGAQPGSCCQDTEIHTSARACVRTQANTHTCAHTHTHARTRTTHTHTHTHALTHAQTHF